MTPRAASHACGSTFWLPLSHTSRWTCGPAVADRGDFLARLHPVPGPRQELVDVAVDGDGAVGVPDLYPQAEPAGGTGLDHGAVGDGHDGGPDGVGDVDAEVLGSPARSEARGEGALRRRDEQGLACLGRASRALGPEPLPLGELFGDHRVGGLGDGQHLGDGRRTADSGGGARTSGARTSGGQREVGGGDVGGGRSRCRGWTHALAGRDERTGGGCGDDNPSAQGGCRSGNAVCAPDRHHDGRVTGPLRRRVRDGAADSGGAERELDSR